MELCEGARVLLTDNLWVQAGLVNGALGVVKGFVWPEGGSPGARSKALSAPQYVIVEFDEVNLGLDATGQPRSFFPDNPERARWVWSALRWEQRMLS